MCSWVIATGSPPFKQLSGEAVAQLCSRTFLRPPIAPKPDSKSFWLVVQSAWDHEHDKRPPASVVEQEVARVLQEHVDLESTARSRSPLHRLSKLLGRRGSCSPPRTVAKPTPQEERSRSRSPLKHFSSMFRSSIPTRKMSSNDLFADEHPRGSPRSAPTVQARPKLQKACTE
jgi:hypothetical protein